MSENRQWKLLQELNFERVGGTEKEREAALLIQKRLLEVGLESKIEDFDVQMSDVQEVSLEVLEPYNKKYEATALKGCANTEDDGLIGELGFFEFDGPVMSKQLKDKIVMSSGAVGIKVHTSLLDCGAKAFITFNGDIDTDRNNTDLFDKEYREVLKTKGALPAVNVKVHDAMEMAERGASKIKIVVKQETKVGKSCNVVAEIKGKSDEVVVCTAHFDSVPTSTGVYDNATGSVCLFEMAAYFMEQEPEHTVRFVWCGSEERGLLGSKAYVEQHKDELDKYRLCVNIDMVGSTMGYRVAVCTSEMDLVHYIDYASKMKGFPIKVSQGVYSSDSTPFAQVNVPAVSFARLTHRGTGSIHSKNDVIEHLSEKYLKEDIAYITEFTSDMVNSYVIPVKKTMPKNMLDDIDSYFGITKDEGKN